MRRDRRSFLQGFAGAMLTLPLLDACSGVRPVARRAALGTGGAKRFIALMTPNGIAPADWFPTGSETGFQLGRNGLPLEPIRSSLLYLRGVDNKVANDYPNRNGHTEGLLTMLTGKAPVRFGAPEDGNYRSMGPSLDQVIARAQRDAGYVPKLGSVHLGESPGSGHWAGFSYDLDHRLAGFSEPRELFNLLFADAGQTEEARARARALKKSVLDGTLTDFQRLAQSVSGEDKRRIDAHLEAVRGIEKQLENVAVCGAPSVNLNPLDDDAGRTLYYDLLVAAMTCDATRVATAAFYAVGGFQTFVRIPESLDIHTLSHIADAEGFQGFGFGHDGFNQYHQWFARKLLYLVQKMQAVELPDGKTLFDETVVFLSSDNSTQHTQIDMPYLLVAGASTGLRTGRFVTLGGVPHNHLLVTLAHAFGLPIDSFGDLPHGAGNLDSALLA